MQPELRDTAISAPIYINSSVHCLYLQVMESVSIGKYSVNTPVTRAHTHVHMHTHTHTYTHTHAHTHILVQRLEMVYKKHLKS